MEKELAVQELRKLIGAYKESGKRWAVCDGEGLIAILELIEEQNKEIVRLNELIESAKSEV